jgi:hypothetical protein
MARLAGMTLRERWSGWQREPLQRHHQPRLRLAEDGLPFPRVAGSKQGKFSRPLTWAFGWGWQARTCDRAIMSRFPVVPQIAASVILTGQGGMTARMTAAGSLEG